MLFGGCTSFPLPDEAQFQSWNVPNRHVIENVPVIEQDDHYCGPAAVATVAQYNDIALPQQAAAQRVYTPGRQGTLQHDVVTALQRSGLIVVPVNNTQSLIQELAADNPVIVFQNLGLSWHPVWHYSVITGYDLPEGKMLVHGGTKEAKWQSLSTVGKTWERTDYWGYTAVQAGKIPPTANEDSLLEAIAGLEKAGFLPEAKRAYEAVLKHYPQSVGSWFGLGNIAMVENQFDHAEFYYRRALDVNPRHAYSANNLAYSLSKQDKTTEACGLLRSVIQMEKKEDILTILQDSYHELCGTSP